MKSFIKQHVTTLLVAGVIAGLVGSFVVVTGVAPIRASDGHWKVTEWFLQFSKRRSVATHSRGIKVPDLTKQSLITVGAGHYEIGCRVCHGRPNGEVPEFASAMTPKPPMMADVVETYEPQELFYIVKHGILFAGMPSWPEQKRDDEVWAVIAFLKQLPHMDNNRYLDLAYAGKRISSEETLATDSAMAMPSTVEQTCVNCHGNNGTGPANGAFPSIAGQNSDYLKNTLRAYKSGARHSGIMETIASLYDEDELVASAAYYAQQKPYSSRGTLATLESEAQMASFERGESIALNGVPQLSIPSCIDCHPVTKGEGPSNYPVLRDLSSDYIATQLTLLRHGQRGGSQAVKIMEEFASKLTDEQIADVSLFYSKSGTE